MKISKKIDISICQKIPFKTFGYKTILEKDEDNNVFYEKIADFNENVNGVHILNYILNLPRHEIKKIDLNAEEFFYLIKKVDINQLNEKGENVLYNIVKNNVTKNIRLNNLQIDYLIHNTKEMFLTNSNHSVLEKIADGNRTQEIKITAEQLNFLIEKTDVNLHNKNKLNTIYYLLTNDKKQRLELSEEHINKLIEKTEVKYFTLFFENINNGKLNSLSSDNIKKIFNKILTDKKIKQNHKIFIWNDIMSIVFLGYVKNTLNLNDSCWDTLINEWKYIKPKFENKRQYEFSLREFINVFLLSLNPKELGENYFNIKNLCPKKLGIIMNKIDKEDLFQLIELYPKELTEKTYLKLKEIDSILNHETLINKIIINENTIIKKNKI